MKGCMEVCEMMDVKASGHGTTSKRGLIRCSASLIESLGMMNGFFSGHLLK